MTEALRRVVAEIESLPDEEQDRIANLLQAELDREWDELLESPRSVRMLDEMAERVRRDRQASRSREVPSYPMERMEVLERTEWLNTLSTYGAERLAVKGLSTT